MDQLSHFLDGWTRQLFAAKAANLKTQSLSSLCRLKQLDALYAKPLSDYSQANAKTQQVLEKNVIGILSNMQHKI